MSDYLDNVLNEVPSKKDRQLIGDELIEEDIDRFDWQW